MESDSTRIVTDFQRSDYARSWVASAPMIDQSMFNGRSSFEYQVMTLLTVTGERERETCGASVESGADRRRKGTRWNTFFNQNLNIFLSKLDYTSLQ